MKKFFALLWRGWKKFAHVLGIFNTKVLLSITYFVIIAIVSLLGRMFGADLLDRRMKKVPTFWKEREPQTDTIETISRQF